MRRATVAACLVLALLPACTSEAGPAPTSTSGASAPPVAATPTEQAKSVLVVDLGAGTDQPGVTPDAPGGVTAKGPTSFAVDEDWIHIWDQAKGRLLLFELRPFAAARQPPPIVSLPPLPRDAGGLLAVGHNEWYLRTTRDDGTSVQQFHVAISEPSRGPVVTIAPGEPSIYPRERPRSSVAGRAKGQAEILGHDALGNRYERFTILSGAPSPDEVVELRRIRESDGAIIAIDRRPPAGARDTYVSEGGGLYELRWDDALPPRRAEITQLLAPLPRSTACPDVVQAALPPIGATRLWPTRTSAEVRAGLATDAGFRHTLEDVAGVRQESNPLRALNVPRCAVGALTVGDPVFVRSYPKTAGTWYVPVLYQDRRLMLAMVGRNLDGLGTEAGSRGDTGAFPTMDQPTALRIGGVAGDPAVSAELVGARPQMPRPCEVAWRVVRSSGTTVYVFPDFPGRAPDGFVAPEAEVELGSC